MGHMLIVIAFLLPAASLGQAGELESYWNARSASKVLDRDLMSTPHGLLFQKVYSRSSESGSLSNSFTFYCRAEPTIK